jgi:hypothetical protein
MNNMVIAILIFQVACSLLCSFLAMAYNNQNYEKYWYLKINTHPVVDGLISFLTYLTLTNMIPISLTVSLDILRLFSAYFI